MRPAPRSLFFRFMGLAPTALTALLSVSLVGCSTFQTSRSNHSSPRPDAIANNDVAALIAQSQQQAQRAQNAWEQHPEQATPRNSPNQQEDAPQIHWLNTANAKPQHKPQPVQRPSHNQPLRIDIPARETEPVKAPIASTITPHQRLNQQELLDQLMDDIATRDDPAMRLALTAATLAMVDPERPIDSDILAPLSPRQQRVVQQFRDVVIQLSNQLEADPNLDLKRITDHLGPILDLAPITIQRAELCTSVSDFGIYETFPSRTFLAGRSQKMIVYLELDNFRSEVNRKTGKHTVKLTQEVVLYNESDGLAVWRQKPVNVLDESHSRRHDFFVVQMIQLPARLTVGKYRLKVRVTDQQGESLDETDLPIQFVADQKLVQR